MTSFLIFFQNDFERFYSSNLHSLIVYTMLRKVSKIFGFEAQALEVEWCIKVFVVFGCFVDAPESHKLKGAGNQK